MLAFFVGQSPVWSGDLAGLRGEAYHAPHWDDEHHPNYNLWTFTTTNTGETILCHTSDFESVGEELEGIYRWMAVERYQDNQARTEVEGIHWLESPAFLRNGMSIWENHVGGFAVIVKVAK